MQCRGADEQVLKRKLDTLRFLLAFDAPSQPRDFECHWVNRYVARQSLDKFQAALLLNFGPGPISTVDQLGDTDDGHADFDFSLAGANLSQDFQHGVPSAFGGDDNAGVENYSHDGGFHGLR
jgi:hypothetical protein